MFAYTTLGQQWLHQFTHEEFAVIAIQRHGRDTHLVQALVTVAVCVQGGMLFAIPEQAHVRTILAILMAGFVLVVTDTVTGLTDRLYRRGPVSLFVGLVDCDDPVVAIDHHKRCGMTIDQ